MTVEANRFWTWSVQRYALKDVEKSLLTLQDEFGLNVNILLWCCWCATEYDEVTELVMRKAIDLTDRWRTDVTGALRATRRSLSSPPPQADPSAANSLREKIKSAELDAERIEQTMLQQLAQANLTEIADPNTRRCARRNVVRYVTLTGCVRSARFSTALLEEMIDLIFVPAEQAQDAPVKP